MSMGDRIRYLRESRGMTQEELGAKIGVQKSAIRKYEKGEVENIKRSSIKIMADLFGVSPCYLMGWDEEDERINELSEEVKFIEKIQAQYGKEAVQLLSALVQLNDMGKQKALENIQDLLDVPKYRKED
ncbi:MAG: helix-turn-helix transcriptional regulator [Clostridia bacterium]|nr:helix-turn-helix transcriptional regulator [Clostridia bacterium]